MVRLPSLAMEYTAEQTVEARKTVDAFLDFAYHSADDMAGSVFWCVEMDRLLGDIEAFQNTGDTSFLGVPKIRETLTESFLTRGLSGLKASFIRNLGSNTKASKFGPGMDVVYQKIIDYELPQG